MKKLLLILVLIAALGFGWYRYSLQPVALTSQDRQTVKIAQGMSVKQIAALLEEKGVIRSAFAFTLAVRFSGEQGSLQAGKFVLRPSQSVAEIIDVLHSGKAEELIITIPEGFTVKDIDALLTEKGVIASGALLRCAQTCDFSSFAFLPDSKGLADRGGRLEGYLFPDTYYVSRADFVPKFFLERLLTTFDRKVLQTLAADFSESKRSSADIIVMASLIEKESRNDDERPVVAGILWKRFDAELGLGVDATVRYILEKPTGTLTAGDLNVASDYNTRKFKGLPPGPIASPGIGSIRAALRSKDSPYWYYLHGTDGEIHYAQTNEEQNLNRYLYIRGGSLKKLMESDEQAKGPGAFTD
ncbi:MAG: endolytic transglycosylase MltG [Candidatus Peribacteraceae bacterium]|nr:endolytic transglycosylase MltG [Candidatus Peribacteraceae bacterium]